MKRQRVDRGDAELPIYATKFDEADIKAEERRPKKKVAVMIGYSGTGYRGMQLAHDQKTIEGDLFQAFVAAGAISKANADDPKKSSFVRCARTDKGVHAAGNVISLKLIVEDGDIVQKINDKLSTQIRVWGYERTNNSFSSYQLCDSRIYEYLIPTSSFLPPHPSSYLGRKVEQIAGEKGDVEGLAERQREVKDFWEKVEDEQIKPLLDEYDEKTRAILEKALYLRAENVDPDHDAEKQPTKDKIEDAVSQGMNGNVEEPTISVDPAAINEVEDVEPVARKGRSADDDGQGSDFKRTAADEMAAEEMKKDPVEDTKLNPITEATKRLRDAYVSAKRAYRISPERLRRIKKALALYEGTCNYHNYTVHKTFSEASSKRVIKSFRVNPEPILINGTEWLSMKVHGQSFMMHQIRKMVGMVALVVRCGCDPKRIVESYGPDNISIPKAPSLGLLLERPIFESYNKRARGDFGKETIDFDKYKKEMDEFKQREIYERMYRDEEERNVFGGFFNQIDNFPDETFLFVTSGGIAATKPAITKSVTQQRQTEKAAMAALNESDSEDERVPRQVEDGDEG